MKPSAPLLTVLAALACAAPAVAQGPRPTPTMAAAMHKVPLTSLQNPNARHTPAPMSGRACNSGVMANRALRTINPINNQPRAAPIVSIPLTKNGESVATATTRAQQAQACAHATH